MSQDSETRERNLRLVARVRSLYGLDEPTARAPRREKTVTAQRAPVGGLINGDAAGRGEIPGRPIEVSPGREKVPTPEAAEGRPPSGAPTVDPRIESYLIAAAAVQVSGRTFRSTPDLREMLAAEVKRLMRSGEYEFIDALEVAKRQIVADIKGGFR